MAHGWVTFRKTESERYKSKRFKSPGKSSAKRQTVWNLILVQKQRREKDSLPIAVVPVISVPSSIGFLV